MQLNLLKRNSRHIILI